jgi:hypothetical protein
MAPSEPNRRFADQTPEVFSVNRRFPCSAGAASSASSYARIPGLSSEPLLQGVFIDRHVPVIDFE